MHHSKIGFLLRLFTLLVFSLGVFIVCSDDSDQSVEQVASKDQSAAQTDSALIEKSINEALTRWSYGDGAALYDMEFEYVQDKYTYDEYLEQPTIKNAALDSFYQFKVKSLEMFDHDSALVDNVIFYKGHTGKISEFPQKVMVYYYKGRWVRPFLGVAELQWQYDEMIRKADSAAAVEEAERQGN